MCVCLCERLNGCVCCCCLCECMTFCCLSLSNLFYFTHHVVMMAFSSGIAFRNHRMKNSVQQLTMYAFMYSLHRKMRRKNRLYVSLVFVTYSLPLFSGIFRRILCNGTIWWTIYLWNVTYQQMCFQLSHKFITKCKEHHRFISVNRCKISGTKFLWILTPGL